MRTRLFCLLVVFTLGAGVMCRPLSALSAQEPSETEPVIETREVVISATKTPIPLTRVTSAVEVIKGEELEQKKTKSVIDALRLAQGVFAFSQGGPGTIANVRMRGAQSKHTLVVVDGAIVNSPTDGAFNFANLTAENIERIEVLRGAQSMLWGADAIGGVVNIITKKGTGIPTVSAFSEFGSFATLREGVSASGQKGPVDFAFSFSRWDTSSFSAIDYRLGATERDGFHNTQVSARLGVALPKDGRLELSLRWYRSIVNFDGFAGNNDPADILGAKARQRDLFLTGTYEQPLTAWWTQKLTLARANERTRDNNGSVGKNVVTGGTITADPSCGFPTPLAACFFPAQTDLDVVNQRLEWQHNFQVAKPLLLTAGYQFREEQGKSAGFYGVSDPNKIISSHAGFAQAQVNLLDRILLTGGFRQDNYNVFGDATTYRVTGGFLIHETGTKLRSSYGTGFRTPTLNDLFFQFNGAPAGNPNLKPERSKSFDVGVDQTLFSERVQLSAAYFWNRFQDLIQFPSAPVAGCPAGTFGFCPINLAAAKSQGWELAVKAQLLKGLEVHGQYTMTLTRDLQNGRRLPRWPIDQASFGLTYQPLDPVRIKADYRIVGSQFNDTTNKQVVGAFGVVNLSATYDLTKNWQIYGRIDNLFNEKYQEVLFFGTPIRSIYGGIKFTY
jgi:vitamin B12 transporter